MRRLNPARRPASACLRAQACRRSAATRSIDASWTPWVIENLELGAPVDSIIDKMVESGFGRLASMRFVHGIDAQIGSLYRQLYRKQVSLMQHMERLRALAPEYKVIERRPYTNRQDFLRNFIAANRPVILTDIAADWPARRKWTPAYLAQCYGEAMVEAQVGRDNERQFELNKECLRRIMPMRELVERVQTIANGNDVYLTANNGLLRRPEFGGLLADIGTLPDILDRGLLTSMTHLWFGPAGTVTPLHHDESMLMHTQIVGRKRWRLISPYYTARLYNTNAVFSPIDLDQVDEQKYPDFHGVPIFEVVIEAGETIFLPPCWWHQVTSLDLCISLSMTNFVVDNDFRCENPTAH